MGPLNAPRGALCKGLWGGRDPADGCGANSTKRGAVHCQSWRGLGGAPAPDTGNGPARVAAWVCGWWARGRLCWCNRGAGRETSGRGGARGLDRQRPRPPNWTGVAGSGSVGWHRRPTTLCKTPPATRLPPPTPPPALWGGPPGEGGHARRSAVSPPGAPPPPATVVLSPAPPPPWIQNAAAGRGRAYPRPAARGAGGWAGLSGGGNSLFPSSYPSLWAKSGGGVRSVLGGAALLAPADRRSAATTVTRLPRAAVFLLWLQPAATKGRGDRHVVARYTRHPHRQFGAQGQLQ